MPTGMTSYRSRSIAASTPAAVAQLIECSLDRPPNRRATTSLSVIRGPFTLGLVRIRGEMRGDVLRFERTGEYLADLPHDGHLDSARLRQRQDGRDRGETFSGLVHLLHHIRETVALAEPAS